MFCIINTNKGSHWVALPDKVKAIIKVQKQGEQVVSIETVRTLPQYLPKGQSNAR